MSNRAESLLPLVPYLRRYASMLTGSRELGDQQLALCLELVVAEPERLRGDDLLVELFQAFHVVSSAIDSIDHQWASLTGGYRERLKSALGLLPLAQRRALLLVVVEDFTVEQAAQILGLKGDAVRQELSQARAALEQLIGHSVLIIEDEPLIARHLKDMMAGMGFSSSRLVSSMDMALDALQSEEPDLVLADLQLAGEGDGLQAARDILRKRQVPIVFVTGYPERLSTLDGEAPAFVVAKPFTKSRLASVVDEAMATYASTMGAAHRRGLIAKLDRLTAAA